MLTASRHPDGLAAWPSLWPEGPAGNAGWTGSVSVTRDPLTHRNADQGTSNGSRLAPHLNLCALDTAFA